jgi:hypothetical protein
VAGDRIRWHGKGLPLALQVVDAKWKRPAGYQSAPAVTAGNQSSGYQSAPAATAGNQSAGNQSAGNQSAPAATAGNQSTGYQSAPALTAGNQSAPALTAGNKSTRAFATSTFGALHLPRSDWRWPDRDNLRVAERTLGSYW